MMQNHRRSIAVLQTQYSAVLFNVKSYVRHGYCLTDLFPQLLLGGIIWQVDPVEAGMGSRVGVLVPGDPVDGKLLEVSVVSLEDGKAPGWDSGGSGHKLQEACLHLLVKVVSNNLPEPLDNTVSFPLRFVITRIPGVVYPVVHINGGETAQNQFQLVWVKDRQGWFGNNIKKSLASAR